MVSSAGLEPAISSLSARCLHLLGHDDLAESAGFEPAAGEPARFSKPLPWTTRPTLHAHQRRASNPAPCCASARTPREPAAGLEPAPRAYETRAPPVVLRWHGAGGESRTRGCRLTRPVRHHWLAGMALFPRGDPSPRWPSYFRWERRIRTSNLPGQNRTCCQVAPAPIALVVAIADRDGVIGGAADRGRTGVSAMARRRTAVVLQPHGAFGRVGAAPGAGIEPASVPGSKVPSRLPTPHPGPT